MKTMENIYDLNQQVTKNQLIGEMFNTEPNDTYIIRMYNNQTNIAECKSFVELQESTKKSILVKIIESTFKDLFKLDGFAMYQSDKFITKLLVHCEYFKDLKTIINDKNYRSLIDHPLLHVSPEVTANVYRKYYLALMNEFMDYCNNSEVSIDESLLEETLITLCNICYISDNTNYNSKRIIDICVIDEAVSIHINEVLLSAKRYN